VPSTIDGHQYTCWTLDENRSIAYKLYLGQQYENLSCQLQDKVKNLDFLIMTYQQDSATCRNVVIDLNTKAVVLEDQNKRQANELLLDKKKIKNKNIALWVSIPAAIIEAGVIIYKLSKGE